MYKHISFLVISLALTGCSTILHNNGNPPEERDYKETYPFWKMTHKVNEFWQEEFVKQEWTSVENYEVDEDEAIAEKIKSFRPRDIFTWFKKGDEEKSKSSETSKKKELVKNTKVVKKEKKQKKVITASKGTPIKPQGGFWMPVKGDLIRSFEEGTKNIDISADSGSVVEVVDSGEIIFAGNGPGEYGLTVIVSHKDSLLTAYANLETISVNEKDIVLKGQEIGTVGARNGQSYLKLELRKKGKAVNPIGIILQK